MEAKALGNTEVRKRILYILKDWALGGEGGILNLKGVQYMYPEAGEDQTFKSRGSLIKKKNKLSSCVRKFDWLHSHI
jgi:hypothetical protein